MKKLSRHAAHRRRGGGLVVAMVTLLVVTMLMGSIIRSLLVELRQNRQEVAQVQAHWLAEAAIDRAAARLRSGSDYQGETWKVDLPLNATSATNSRGVVEVHVTPGEEGRPTLVSVEAKYPDDPRRQVKVERAVSIPSSKKTQSKDSAVSDTRQENSP